MKKTLIIGCARTEIINHVVSLPKGNEEAQSLNIEQRTGGYGFICADLFQHLSFPYQLIAPVGTGVYGDLVRDQAAQHGIEMDCSVDEINGCCYEMIDRSGRRSMMIVPGGEYVFDKSFLQSADPDEIDKVVIFSEIITDEYGMDIVDALHQLAKPVTFVFNGDVSQLDNQIKKAILNLSPSFILYDTDLYYFNDQKNVSLDQAAEAVNAKMKQPLYILTEGEGCYAYGDRGATLYKCSDYIDAGIFSSFLTAAKAASNNEHKSVSFALESARICAADPLDENLIEQRKNRLAEVIADK